MSKKILAVTGCPTGIAHTFMAEKALKEAAKELGCEIKVETNGAIGVENALTAKEIREADAIIVACDKNVEMDRFNGKPVIEVSVTDGINKAKELIVTGFISDFKEEIPLEYAVEINRLLKEL